MLTATRRADRGFTLVEMMVVIGLLGTVIGVIFGAVQVLSMSASTSMEESASAHDLSYSMEVLSKALMSGRVVYADDYQVQIVTTVTAGVYQLQSIYATSTPGATRGSLVWERWNSNENGAVAPGAVPTFRGVMSDRNMNTITPKVPLFAYYTGTTDDTTASVSAGLYAVTQIKRIRLTVAAAFGTGVRKDSRDIYLR